MTTGEYRSHFTLWAALKSPLLIGCDLDKISPADLAILLAEEVIAVNQDPLGCGCSYILTFDANVDTLNTLHRYLCHQSLERR